jgi:hypothetical protein
LPTGLILTISLYSIQSKLSGGFMLKEAGGIVGGALVFSPLGVPILLHGLAGVVVGGAGLFVADAVVKQVVGVVNDMASQQHPPEESEVPEEE